MYYYCKTLCLYLTPVLLLLVCPVARSSEDVLKVLDIRDPGSDLANYPNSAYTLRRGQFYLEMTPAFYTGPSNRTSAQFNAEYLLRYGLLNWWEIRLYSQGFSVQGNPNPAVGFSPLTFDTKVHLWDQVEDYYIPAGGFEVLVQTTWLSSPAFKGGTQPSFSLNLDGDLPFELELEVNIGAARFLNPNDLSTSIWDFTFSWALQREMYKDVDVFFNAFHNGGNLPRLSRQFKNSNSVCSDTACADGTWVQQNDSLTQHAAGGGLIWTLNDQWSVFGNVMVGLSPQTPNVQVYTGFAFMP